MSTSSIPLGLCQCGCGQKTTIYDRGRLTRGKPHRFVAGHNGKLGPNDFRHRSDGVTEIFIRSDGRVFICLVDTADYPKVQGFRWGLHQGPRNSYPYVVSYVVADAQNQRINFHDLILPQIARKTVDHRNLNGLDNQHQNLRYASESQQTTNQQRVYKRKKYSRFRGVTFHKPSGKWRAQITKDRHYSLGLHATEEDAARAFDAAARRLHGEFARLNFPVSGEQSHFPKGEQP